MACQLSSDPMGFAFRADAGAMVTVFVKGDYNLARLTSAELNGGALPVSGDDRVTFTVVAGRNVLTLSFISTDPGERVSICEDCGGGSSQLLVGHQLGFASLTIEQGPPDWS